VTYRGNSFNHQFLGQTGVPTQSVRSNVNTWLRYNDGLASRPNRFSVPNTANDNTFTTGVSYQTQNGANVVQYTVFNGGHGLPGSRQYLPPRLIGNISQDFNGAQVIWDFFEQNGKND
jgi:poly(3-hydroxybutyrate) depolymerase